MLFSICGVVSNWALRVFTDHALQYVSGSEWWLPACVYMCGLMVLLLLLRKAEILGSNAAIALGYATIVGAYPSLFLSCWQVWSAHFDNSHLPLAWIVGGAAWGVAIHNVFIFIFGEQATEEFWRHVRENYSTNGRPKQ